MIEGEIQRVQVEIKMQGQLLTAAGHNGEPAPNTNLKQWIETDRIVRREQERMVAVGKIGKRKLAYEFKAEDWLDMLSLLPDIIGELDHDIAE